ncbi:alpha/beta hydrolase-fold protein [Dactylosporangium sp. NPDC000244]|uniref:alpha/beta hydrolase n=1 Tax=Dactylosporangium sp. NPDC000244 TaxID=3154365 RepID=UPI003326E47B
MVAPRITHPRRPAARATIGGVTDDPATATRPARRSRPWRIAPAAAVVIAAGLAWLAAVGALDRVPLLDRPIAAGLETAGLLCLGFVWVRPGDRRTRRSALLLGLGVAAAVGVLALALRTTGTVTDAYPPSFAAWIGAAFAAIAGCPLALGRPARWGAATWRRAAAVAAVPLTVVGALMLIDQEYGIWPTAGDMLGHDGTLRGADARRALDGAPAARSPAGGTLMMLDAPATVSHFAHRPGAVYLPPAYYGPHRADLPVLVMLVGAPGTPINWLKAGGGEATDDAYAATHGGVAPVLVVADQNGSATGDTECVDGPRGNAETYLTTDVPAFITGTLHLRHDASRWGIVGFSEGGTCALDLVLGHPGIYRHAVDLGGDARPNLGSPEHSLVALYGGRDAAPAAHDPALLLAHHTYPGVTLWFAAGQDDPRCAAVSRQLAALAMQAGIPTHQFVGSGGHNWQFASAALRSVLAPLSAQMGLPGPGATT